VGTGGSLDLCRYDLLVVPNNGNMRAGVKTGAITGKNVAWGSTPFAQKDPKKMLVNSDTQSLCGK